jgi:uncharacterized membrane protein
MAFSPAYHHHQNQRATSLSSTPLRLEESRSTLRTDRRKLQRHTSALFAQEMKDDDTPTTTNSIWMPQLRRIMASLATAGALETAYLSYNKLVLGGSSPLCGANGSCDSVLTGPYSNIPFTDIPLAVVGCVAYVTVGVLALAPLLLVSEDADDSSNRVALTTLTTAMGTFSVFLMTLLFGVLQTTCPLCIFSAACSVMLGMMAWLSGCLPPQKTKEGAQASGAAFLATTMAAVVLFMSSDASMAGSTTADGSINTLSFSTSLLAASSTDKLNAPPAISTISTEREIKLATQLQTLDAKMYGAYWCSHCYDQKQTFGKEAFAKIPYLECSKDGVNSQSKVCKAREVPGYPTWEINGKLYPGEQELVELEDLVKEIQSGN